MEEIQNKTLATRLEPEGAIDISRAMELKRDLVQALEGGEDILISLERVTGLHVSAVQLLWAAKRDAARTGLQFRYAGALSKEILARLSAAGLDRVFHSEEAL